MKVLNKILTKDRFFGIRFIDLPVVLPIDLEGRIVKPEESLDIHYSSIVVVEEIYNSPHIFEFPDSIAGILESFSKRYDRIADLEFLVSRETTGELRIIRGRNENTSIIRGYSKYKRYSEKLYDKYLNKIGYKVKDY